MTARQATPADADELVRLRAVMLRTLSPPDGSPPAGSPPAGSPPAGSPPAGSLVPASPGWDDDWREPARRELEKRLTEAAPTMVAFVVDRPDGTGLAACVVGAIDHRLGGPGNPSGRAGYVFSVATDPDMRRRGYSRACMTALLEWYQQQGISKIALRASPNGEPLYRSLGFARTKDPAMRLDLPVRDQP
jgi:GNAT superfamily N-acetyltransferase